MISKLYRTTSLHLLCVSCVGALYVENVIPSANFVVIFEIAPLQVLATSESTSALGVTIGASPTSSVSKYKASSNGRFCEVATSASPLTCTLSGLSAGEKYTVQVVACLENGICSEPIERIGYTLPNGRPAFSGSWIANAGYLNSFMCYSSIECLHYPAYYDELDCEH